MLKKIEWLNVLLSLICACVVFSISGGMTYFADQDPDRFYHYSISKSYAETGLPDTVPQAKGIGWDKGFVEKEFLFHILTGLAYKFDQEHGVDVFIRVLFALIVASLVWIANRLSGRLFLGTFVAIAIAMLSAHFPFRMLFLRPHVLANLLFIWMVWAFAEDKLKGAAVFAFLYCLAYHSFYVPILVFASWAVSTWCYNRQALAIKPILMFFLTIATALIVNPYFPGNILLGLTHLKIAVKGTKIPVDRFGTELVPVTTDKMINMYGIQILAVICIILLLAAKRREDGSQLELKGKVPLQTLGFLILLSLGWGGAIAVNPRAAEYFIPSSTLMLAAFAYSNKITRYFVSAVLVTFTIHNFKNQRPLWQQYWQLKGGQAESYQAAINTVSQTPKGRLVFNCNWSSSPYIMYYRPDLTFVDLLDPTFLHNYNEFLSEEKWKILDGKIADPVFHINADFNAMDILCEPSPLTENLHKDPETISTFPTSSLQRSEVFAFVLSEAMLGSYLTKFNVGVASGKPILGKSFKELSYYKFLDVGWDATDPKNKFKRYLYFYEILQQKNAEADANKIQLGDDACFAITIPNSSIPAQADIIGFGYHGAMELYVDGSLRYRSLNFEEGKPLNHFFRINAAQKNAAIEAYICSPANEFKQGFSVSFYERRTLENRCRDKVKYLTPDLFPKSITSNYTIETCGIPTDDLVGTQSF